MNVIHNSGCFSHREILRNICKKADELVIASPFCYEDFADFANTIAMSGMIRKVTFITTLQKDGLIGKIDNLISFGDSMDRIKVDWELRLDEQLHGKVYIFKRESCPFSALITSANLTNNGMSKNHEWGYVVNEIGELQFIESQILGDATTQLTRDQMSKIK